MNNMHKAIILGIVITLSVVSSAYFFQQSNLSPALIPQLSNPQVLLGPLSNTSFWLGIILFAFTLMLFYAATLTLQEKEAMITAAAGTAIGLLLSILLFNNPLFFSLVGLAFLTGSVVFVKMSNAQRMELRWLKNARAAGSATGKLNLLIAIGLFVSVAAVSYTPSNRIILNQTFEDFVTKQALDSSDSLTDAGTDLLIQTQQQGLNVIQNLPTYQALLDNDNVEDQAFVGSMNLISEQLNSPSFKEEIRKKMAQQGGTNQATFSKVVQQIPLIKTIEDNWWWMVALTVTLVFLFISNIIIKPLVMMGAAFIAFLVGIFTQNPKTKSSP